MVFATLMVTGASLTASLLVVEMAILPLVFKYSKSVQRKIVFSNCINYPKNTNYDHPSTCNLYGARNCTIEFPSKTDNCVIQLGLWHIVPCPLFKYLLIEKDRLKLTKQFHEELKNTSNTIVLYCHGNSSHRATPHRTQLYRVFQQLDFHVIAFDYRGYGDSTSVNPTEKGVVEDCFYVYSWLMDTINTAKKPTIVLWGHSLGSAVAANFVSNLKYLCQHYSKESLPMPDAVVLEAPFNNLGDEVEFHPFSKLVSWLPYFKNAFVKPFTTSSEYVFTTDEYLKQVPDIPCLILHSKADRIVPYHLAVKLYNELQESRKNNKAPLVFYSFEKEKNLGHNNICEAPELSSVVRNFLNLVRNKDAELMNTT